MSARFDGQGHDDDPCRARGVLAIVGDKWALLIVRHLSGGPRRFSALKRDVEGISQRMLTVTLRDLERDGILTRTVRNVMPPHVEYELTSMGVTLRQAAAPLLEWSIEHLEHIDVARAAYDARKQNPPA
ncbi:MULTISPECIES: helix-turn-helix domain-containing protein [unclassified Streptomyces]|uniref:winged helix-turn-helix transcriptional regulator n=1 Tax=unclassified Streptomyces TaxID=2593676 RepID=UPI00331C2CA4